MRPKLSRAQQLREMQEGRWERYTLWYWKVPKEKRKYNSDWGTHKKTFHERSQIDEFLDENPDYSASRIDTDVKTIIWISKENE